MLICVLKLIKFFQIIYVLYFEMGYIFDQKYCFISRNSDAAEMRMYFHLSYVK